MGEEKEPAVKPEPTKLSHNATASRMGDIADEIRRVAKKETVNAEDDTYLEELRAEFDELDAHRKKIERQALVARVDVATKRPLQSERAHTARDLDDDPFGEPDSIRDGGVFSNPYDESEMRTWGKTKGQIGSEFRARAYSAIERMAGTNDKRRETMTKILEENDTDSGQLAQMALRTSHPDYLRAFNKAAKGHHNSFTPAESAAVERAMSLTDSAGGFLVPFQLDPTVIITSDGSLNQIRMAAREVIATGDVWNGVSSGAVAWSWDAEASEVSDDATTFAQPSIPIYKARGFVPISHEALQDEQNVAAEVGRLLAFGKETLEAAAFAVGAGSTEPTGIVTALTGTASEIETATLNTTVLADIYTLEGALPARYRSSASFLANKGVYNVIRQFDTAGGAGLWARLGEGQPARLLDRPAYESEDMSSATSTTTSFIMVYGDLSNYVIADRIGVTVDFIPHLFHTTSNRPSGQSGWYASYRVGADSVNDGGMRLLSVK